MASSSADSVFLNWFLNLPATWWGEEWAKEKYGSHYDKHFDRVKLFAFVPSTNKSEPAYKFNLGKSKNKVIGITDLHRFNGLGYLSGDTYHLSSLLLFVT